MSPLCGCGAHELPPGAGYLVAEDRQHAFHACTRIGMAGDPGAGSVALEYLVKAPWQRGKIGIDSAALDVKNLVTERNLLRDALIALRDRLFVTCGVLGAIAMDEPDPVHEDSTDCLGRNFAVITATHYLDPTDRSPEDWTVAAAGRCEALTGFAFVTPPNQLSAAAAGEGGRA